MNLKRIQMKSYRAYYFLACYFTRNIQKEFYNFLTIELRNKGCHELNFYSKSNQFIKYHVYIYIYICIWWKYISDNTALQNYRITFTKFSSQSQRSGINLLRYIDNSWIHFPVKLTFPTIIKKKHLEVSQKKYCYDESTHSTHWGRT